MGHACGGRDDAEVASQDQAGGQRVGHAALEDQVGVHQAVAHNGPTECERQKDDGKPCEIGEQAGYAQVEEEGNSVKQRERNNREQRSSGEPLQLLAQQRRVGAAITAHEQSGCQHVEDGVVGRSNLIEPVLEECRGLPEVDGIKPQGKQRDAGRVDERQKPAAAKFLKPLFWETESEMKKQCRLQGFSQHVRPEDGPVERVECAGVLERIQCERNQAEDVEVSGARSRPAAKEHVDADGQIDEPNHALAQRQAPVHWLRDYLDDYLSQPARRGAAASELVVDLEIVAGAVEGALEIGQSRDIGKFDLGGESKLLVGGVLVCRFRQFLDSGQGLMRADPLGQARANRTDGQNINPRQQVALVDACVLSGAIRQYLVCYQPLAIGSLTPPDAVVRLLGAALLHEIQYCQRHQASRNYGQQCRLQAVEVACFHREAP